LTGDANAPLASGQAICAARWISAESPAAISSI
jgi:hypothetical protein